MYLTVIRPSVENAPSTRGEGMIMVVRVFRIADGMYPVSVVMVPCVCYIVVPTVWPPQ